MTEPTDSELWQLHMQMPGVHKNPIDFARAVLAKWGTPPAVAGEPVAWRYVPSKVWGEFVYTEDPKRAQHARDNGIDVQPVFTTPQPTQPQAGAVPTDWDVRVGTLPTMTKDEYPGLGDWWVQLRLGPDFDQVLARVYGASPDEARWRAFTIAARLGAATQAQPRAVPLTPAQVVEASCVYWGKTQLRNAFEAGARFAEQHHGIKGGQHGADN